MNPYTKLFTEALLLVCAIALPICTIAMPPDQLRAVLEAGHGDRVVVIDIRGQAAFVRGHIAGAMRIPALGLESRRVPAFGRVVVVWDGIDEVAARRALAALDNKPGIDAELLDGGYPAWVKVGGYPAAANAGVRDGGTAKWANAHPPGVTWKQLMLLADGPDLVVLDLRHAPRHKGAGPVPDQPVLTDLAALLPNARIVAPLADERQKMKRTQHSAQGLDRHGVRKRSVPRWLRGQDLDADSIYVLVDAGDGRLSERVARRLAARGLKRVYLLLGGERTLVSRGEPELITRSGASKGGGGQ